MSRDYYDILHLTRSADAELIEKAYRLFMRRLHPDRAGGGAAETTEDGYSLKLVQEAYSVLSDPALRHLYDQGLLAPARIALTGGADIYQLLSLRFEQAIRGGIFSIQRLANSGARTIDVQVPRGVEMGQRLRITGQGHPSSNGGPPGDLILILSITEHPHFRRDGLDLHVDVLVPVDVAMLGGKVTVQTLDGAVNIEVPPGASSGDRLRVRAAGLSNSRGQHGDLYAIVQVQIPRQAADEARRFARQQDKPAPAPPPAPSVESESPALQNARAEVEQLTSQITDLQARDQAQQAAASQFQQELAAQEIQLQNARQELERHKQQQLRDLAEKDSQLQLLSLEIEQQKSQIESLTQDQYAGKTEAQKLQARIQDEFQRQQAALQQQSQELSDRQSQMDSARQKLDQKLAEQSEQEQRLRSDQRRLEEQHTQFASKTRELESLLNSAKAGQAELQKQSQSLIEREDQLKSDRRNLEQQQSQFDTKSKELLAETQRLQSAHQQKSLELDDRENQLRAKAIELEQSQKQLESKTREYQAAQAAAAAQAARDRAELKQKLAEIESKTQELETARIAVENQQSRNQAELQRQQTALDQQQSELAAGQERLKAAGAAADARHQLIEMELQQRSAVLEQQAADLAANRAQWQSRQSELSDQELALKQQASLLATETQSLADERQSHLLQTRKLAAEMAEQASQLDRRQAQLADGERQLSAHAAALESRQLQLREQQQILQQSQVTLEQQRSTLESDRVSLQAQQSKYQDEQAQAARLQAKLEAGVRSLQTERAGLDQQRQQLTQSQADLAQQAAQIARQLESLAQDRHALESDRRLLDGARTASAQQMNQAVDSERARLRELQEQLTLQQAQIADERAADLLKIQLKEQAIESQQRQLIEQRQAAERMIQENRAHAAQLEAQAAESAARQIRLTESERKMDEQHHQLESLAATLDQRQRELTEHESTLRASGDQSTRQLEADRAQLEQLRRKLTEQEAQLAQLTEQLNARQAELEQRLHTVERTERRQLERQQQLQEQEAALKQRAEELESRHHQINTIQRRLEQIEKQLTAATPPAAPAPAPAAAVQAPANARPVIREEPKPAAGPAIFWNVLRAGNRPVFGLPPHHVRTAAGYQDDRGMQHLFFDFVHAEQKTTNTWGAQIRYYRSQGPTNWQWGTTLERGRFDETDPAQCEADCFGLASPAIAVAGGQAMLFYAGRGALNPNQKPNMMATRGQAGYLPSRIMLATAPVDAGGTVVGSWTKRGVVLDLGPEWDSLRLDQPAVVVQGQTVHLFYVGYDDSRDLGRRKLGHAVANVGQLQFTRDPLPVLETAGGGQQPRIFHHGDHWHLFYQHFNRTDGAAWRHYISSDLKSWQLHDSRLFTPPLGDGGDLMPWVDSHGRLLPNGPMLVSGLDVGLIKLYPYRLEARG